MQVCTNLKSFYTSLQSHITLRRKSSKTPQRPLQIVSPHHPHPSHLSPTNTHPL